MVVEQYALIENAESHVKMCTAMGLYIVADGTDRKTKSSLSLAWHV